MSRDMSRADRLREMERLYFQRAYSDIELAERLGVNRSTVYKDRHLLETQVPFIRDDHGRWKIDRSSYLSQIRVNLHEALALYLAARRASRQTRTHQPHVASAVEKLAEALRQPMTERLIRSAGSVLQGEAQPERVQVVEAVAQAWAEGRKVRIVHRALRASQPRTYLVCPYLIEPSLWSDGAYLIGHSDRHDGLATFKIERIEQATLTGETFELPPYFDEERLFRYAWGIWFGEGEPVEVRLRFAPGEAARRLKESIWHPTQEITDLENGGCLWKAHVAEWQELLPWVRGWGAACEVLAPVELRETMMGEVRRLLHVYGFPSQGIDRPDLRVLRLWGKTVSGQETADVFHPVVFHMLDVGHIAQALLSERSSPRLRRVLGNVLGADEDSLAAWLPWLVALHDIGKISAPFQEQNNLQKARLQMENFEFGSRVWNNEPYHTFTGQVSLEHEASVPAWAGPVWSCLVDATGGHHGRFTGRGGIKEARQILKYEPGGWSALRVTAADMLNRALVLQPPERVKIEDCSAAIMALTGFMILCDWLGSNSDFFLIRPEASLNEYIQASRKLAYRAVETAGFFQPCTSSAPSQFAALFPEREQPRPLQAAVDKIPEELLSQPCLAIIEAPTGEGKTEAALTLAHRIGRAAGSDELYYALPTTATSNYMYGRVRDYLQNNLSLSTQVKLIHGQAYLVEDDLRIDPLDNGAQAGDHPSMEWFGPKKRALLAPFGVGTVDQAELAALNVPHNALRMIGLAGKVVIFDEVHAYDTYMTTIIERLLAWLSSIGASVILLSATLPKNRRARLAQAYSSRVSAEQAGRDDYPALWVIGRDGTYFDTPPAAQPERALFVHPLHFSSEDLKGRAEWLLDQVAEGGCVCWITNTVDRAQELFDCVDALAGPDIDRMLLHARFPLDERQHLEEALMRKYGPGSENRPARGIVIGTQVLEQSLDLDFDRMVSDLAPIDLMLQRAGRLHRHDRQRPQAHLQPHLYINTELGEHGNLNLVTDSFIYPEFILRQSLLSVRERSELNLPRDYRTLIEDVYSCPEPPPGSELRGAWDKLSAREHDALEQALLRLLPEPDPEDSFCTAASRLGFEEDENSAAWIVGQTRLGQESLNVIPLERQGDVAWYLQAGERRSVSLSHGAERDVQLQLLRRQIRISNQSVISALKDSVFPLPALFEKSSLLKGFLPLWLEQGETWLQSGNKRFHLLLDAKLGLVIKKVKGE